MRTAKISELKAKLSAHIDYVKRGGEVLVLDRNTPVARLVAVGSMEQLGERERRLIAQGALSPPRKPRDRRKKWPLPKGPVVPQEVIDQMWREERDGR